MLSTLQIKSAKPRAKPYKLADSGGLYLLVQPSGSKLWRYKFRIGRVEGLQALGSFPEVGLADVRAEHAKSRKLKVTPLAVGGRLRPTASLDAAMFRPKRMTVCMNFGGAAFATAHAAVPSVPLQHGAEPEPLLPLSGQDVGSMPPTISSRRSNGLS